MSGWLPRLRCESSVHPKAWLRHQGTLILTNLIPILKEPNLFLYFFFFFSIFLEDLKLIFCNNFLKILVTNQFQNKLVGIRL
ncbi:hypothetical protein O6P43_018691 [Quillaja saponaria]|uniref:Uncharacterized protein n=1 Tax=Quillaja saponaria TaxID=32244 RepID=A0AAD7LH99_QUISA|nr:hypothetical protein O6P43_018691 [Quillaja saponaria]